MSIRFFVQGQTMSSARTGKQLAAHLEEQVLELEDACAGLSDAISAQRPQSHVWCVREQLSHLQGDDRETYLGGIHRVLLEDVAELEIVPGITHYSVDRRDYPFVALVDAVCGQYRAMAETADALSAAQIERRVRIELLKDTPFGAEPTIGEWLTAISEMHLPGHIAQIRESRKILGA